MSPGCNYLVQDDFVPFLQVRAGVYTARLTLHGGPVSTPHTSQEGGCLHRTHHGRVGVYTACLTLRGGAGVYTARLTPHGRAGVYTARLILPTRRTW